VAFSGNGERIASRSEGDDIVRIWDASRMEMGAGLFGRKFCAAAAAALGAASGHAALELVRNNPPSTRTVASTTSAATTRTAAI